MLAAAGGFLLAVLWFDLMFDVQALGAPPGPLPEAVLASIAAYYRRVTTDAAPMGYLVGAVMVLAVVTAALRVARGGPRRARHVVSLVLITGPVALALLRVFPNAVELATRADPVAVQSRLARGILRDHLVCLAAIVAFVALEIRVSSARRLC